MARRTDSHGMRRAMFWAWLWVFGLSGTMQVAALDTLRLYGRPYVRLEDWTRASNFGLRWTVPRKEVALTSRWSKVVFQVDSRRSEINGVVVWLSFPVVLYQNSACMAVLDVERTLKPILYRRPRKSPRPIRTVCLDPGHGGSDTGFRQGRLLEKHYTLLLAQELRNQLVRTGFKVTRTRTTDAFISLENRPAIARKRAADLFVSLHFNAFVGAGSSTVRGTEVYCLTPADASSTNSHGEGGDTGPCPGNENDDQNVQLAYEIQKALAEELRTEQRGVKRARFAVLREARMPAVLVEGGFLTNPEEARLIQSTAYRQKLAKAIRDGIAAYKERVERR